jgi:MoxR-like ATPase
MDVLRHRVILSYEAEAEGIDVESIITQLFSKIEVP